MASHGNMTNEDPLTVSVIIPVHNGGKPFIHCVRALLVSQSPPEEIIVTANGCRDRSAEIARLCGAQVIDLTKSVGPAAARNVAVRQAYGDILFFVNADVAVHPDALERVRTCLEKHPEISACFGTYDDAPPERNFFSQYKNLFHHFIHQRAKEKATTFWAGCGAIRRDVFEKMNGFDETYRQPSIEDIELGYRLAGGGYRIQLDKHVLATHLKHWSLASVMQSDIFGRALPWARLIVRSRSIPDDLNTRKHYRLSVVLVLMIAGFLPLGLFTSFPLWPSLLAALVVFVLNMDWYRFALQSKGWCWSILAVAWHWIYYFYSGASFVYVILEQLPNIRTHKEG